MKINDITFLKKMKTMFKEVIAIIILKIFYIFRKMMF